MDTVGVPTGQGQALGIALDPFRPGETLSAPGYLPPSCPLCKHLIYPVATNDAGDAELFECLNEGYETVYRRAKGTWEPRPRAGLDAQGWKPPILAGATPEAVTTSAPPPPSARAPSRAARVPQPAASSVAAPAAAPIVTTEVQGDAVDWVTLADAAAITGSKPDAIYRRVRRGTLSSKHGPDGKILVRGDQLVTAEEPSGNA